MAKRGKKRQRIRFMFWLEIGKAMEVDLADQLAVLKSGRKFAATVRDALRLILDLRAGNTDVLYELFPAIVARIGLEAITSNPPSGGAGELEEIRSMLEIALANKRADEKLMLPVATGSPRPLAVKELSAPVFDDDDDMPLLTVSKSTASGAGLNFLASMKGLVG